MLDRSTAPKAQKITSLNLPKLKRQTLVNGVRLFLLEDSTVEVFLLKMVVAAGVLAEKKPLAASFYQRWLSEGDKNLSSLFEQYGFGFSASATADYFEFTVSGLSDLADKAIDLFDEFVQAKHLEPAEFEQIKKIALEDYKVSSQKTSFQASVNLREAIFGKTHPMGYYICPELLNELTLNDCIEFKNEFLNSKTFDLLLIGNYSQKNLEKIGRLFGEKKLNAPKKTFFVGFDLQADFKKFIAMPQAQQASVAMGKPVCGREHSDYFAMVMLNEVLGGYFGSRLMSTLREKEGLTYGIYSQLSFTKNTGTIYIGADLNRENLDKSLKMIYRELEKLVLQPLEESELQTVKSHIQGSLLRSSSSLFSVGNSLFFSILNELGEDFLIKTLTQTEAIRPTDLQLCAQKYLYTNWAEVSCG